MAQYPYGHSGGQQPTSNEPLPPGWEMIMDKTTGWPFFVDHNTQTTSWQDPRLSARMPQGPGQYNMHHRPGVREIPIIHESAPPGRVGSPKMMAGRGSSNSPARDIPIMREGSNSPHQGGRPQHQPNQHPQYGWTSNIPQQPQREHAPTQQGHYYPGQGPQPTGPQAATYQTQPAAQPHYHYSASHQQPQQPTEPSAGVREIPIIREHATPPRTGDSSGQGPAAGPHQAPPRETSGQPAGNGRGPPPAQVESDSHLSAGDGQSQAQRRSPSPAPAHLTPLEQVQLIYKEAESIEAQVSAFSGGKLDKQYLFLEEMLTRLLIKLDNIDSEGKEEIRNMRRQAVRSVQASLDQLELKAFAHGQPEPPAYQQNASAQNSNQGQPNATENATHQQGQTEENQAAKRENVKEMVMNSEMMC